MNRIYGIIAAVLISVGSLPLTMQNVSAEQPQVSARAAVLISADTGEIVWENNSGQKLPMASTTKIMTTLLCIESGGLDEQFVVDSEAIKVEGSSMGLQEGDIVTKYALCCGMLLPSGNDAANAAAVRIAGSIEDFAVLMNDRARELGMSKTFFVTPSGLEGEGHGSSAYDMAVLAREALRNDIFRDICSKSRIQLEYGNPPYNRWLKNTNKLLDMYEGTYGVKTGFTDEAGRCLVSACERDGKSLICVTLNDKNDWQDHMALYDQGFSMVKSVSPELPENVELPLAGGKNDSIIAVPGEMSAGITSLASEPDSFDIETVSSPFIYAPVRKGDEVGSLRISFKGREVCQVPLIAAEDAEINRKAPEQKRSIADRFLSVLRRIFS
ncbi:MAG: D-alanyl-D-alanine carboxypeptidase [Ruminococcus sp.]|nr:D-alanyl-D-alanine carboxypeptidase [Ruminococcus sp.]